MSSPKAFLAHLRKSPGLLLVAGLLGLCFGLFASGYWLIDFLPAGSRLLMVLAVLLTVVSGVVFAALAVWASARLRELSTPIRVLVIAVSPLVAVALFFGGTSQWQLATHYVPFLLPTHHLTLSVLPGNSTGGGLRISWINTSLGDVPYDTLQLKGWKRQGDELVLVDPAANSLDWSGRTGERAELVFRAQGASQQIQAMWDSDAAEVVHLNEGRDTYQRTLSVPWYASKALVLVLGVVIFAALALALILLLWQRRADVISIARAFPEPSAVRFARTDLLWVLVIIAVALMLRLWNIGRAFPAVDEYYHLIAARQLADGAPLGSVYPRGLWVVSVPAALFLRVFGYELWAARLVGALVNALAIVPLYLLTLRMNRGIAVLSAALFASSPWIVTFARIAREYAFYPFYFYSIILLMVIFIQTIPQGLVFQRDWRELPKFKLLVLVGILVAPPIFALYVDRLSTFRTILLAYPIFGLFVLGRIDWKNRSNWAVLGGLSIGLLWASYVWYNRQKAKIVPFPRYNSVPVEYFLPNPQQQWYFGRVTLLVVAGALLAVLCGYLLRRRNFIPAFVLVLFAGYLAFFAFFSMTFFHTRHLSTTELWYVILVAMGLYFLWRVGLILMPWKTGMTGVLMAAVIGVCLLNVPQIILPAVTTNPDDPISEDYLHDMTQVQDYMLQHAATQDVLVSTVYGFYSSWKAEPKFANQYRVTTETPRDEIATIVDGNPSGWIVIDQIRLSMSGLGPRDFAGMEDVKYIGLFGDENVWYWQHLPAGQGSSIVAGKGK